VDRGRHSSIVLKVRYVFEARENVSLSLLLARYHEIPASFPCFSTSLRVELGFS
jgi:hypothetical protein